MYIHQKNSKERFVFIPIPENEIIKKKPPKIEGKFHVVENSEYLIRMDNIIIQHCVAFPELQKFLVNIFSFNNYFKEKSNWVHTPDSLCNV